MKKYIAPILLCLLIFGLCSCSKSELAPPQLTEEQVSQLREEYPYADPSSILADFEILSVEEQLNAIVGQYTWCMAVVEITSDSSNSTSSYSMNPSSPEAQLDAKIGGNGTQQVGYSSWGATLISDLLGNIPDRLLDDDNNLTLYKTAGFEKLLPDFQKGERYMILGAILPEDSTSRPDKVNQLAPKFAFYITDNGYILSSLHEHDEYSGMSLAQFTDEVCEIQQNIVNATVTE